MPKWASAWFRTVIAVNVSVAVMGVVYGMVGRTYFVNSPIVRAARDAAQATLPEGQYLTNEQRDTVDRVALESARPVRKTLIIGYWMAGILGAVNVVGVYCLEIALTRRWPPVART